MPEAGRRAAGRTAARSSPSRPPRHVDLPPLPRGRRVRPDHRRPPAGTEIGVVTRRGAGEQGRWALRERRRQILPWYNDYFGTRYPLPKLDNVAGPGSSQFFGAMENWGAIFSFENILLVDPAITTEARRQRSSRSTRTKWRTNGSAISSPWPGGTTLAERGLRLVDGDQGDRRAPSRMGAPARPDRRPRGGDRPRFARAPPTRSSSTSPPSTR